MWILSTGTVGAFRSEIRVAFPRGKAAVPPTFICLLVYAVFLYDYRPPAERPLLCVQIWVCAVHTNARGGGVGGRGGGVNAP